MGLQVLVQLCDLLSQYVNLLVELGLFGQTKLTQSSSQLLKDRFHSLLGWLQALQNG